MIDPSLERGVDKGKWRRKVEEQNRQRKVEGEGWRVRVDRGKWRNKSGGERRQREVEREEWRGGSR